MNIIEQNYIGDCSVCCLAMFLDVRYTDMAMHFKDEWENGFIDDVELTKSIEVAEKFGTKLECVYYDFDTTKKMLYIVPALLTKNKKHMIYYDGERILDPSPLKYEKLPKCDIFALVGV